MNLRFLETFALLARIKSFSKTAAALNTTQPAISSRMSRLEEIIGAPLYQRQSRDFELTQAGREALAIAEKILGMAKELEQVGAAAPAEMTQLRIGVIEIATLSWLRRFIERFQEEFGKVVLRITTGATSTLLEELRAGLIDIAFIVGPANERDIDSDQICSFALDWYASPKAFDCDRDIDVIELSQLPIIPYGREAAVSSGVSQYFETYGVVPPQMENRQIVLDCVYSAWSGGHAVREGLGVMALPTFLFRSEIEAGHITQLRVRQKLPARNLTACYKSHRREHTLQHAIALARESAAEFASTQNEREFWL